MFNPGIRNPRLSMRIALGITLVSFAFVAWGVWEMHAAGKETTASGLKIGLALLPALLGPFMVLNFWWAIRIVAALRRGEGVVGRWTIPPAAFAAFVPQDAERSNLGQIYLNDWPAPAIPPAEGIEVIFGISGVVVEDTYYPLARNGLYKFLKVGILPGMPLSIEFVTVATHVSNISALSIRRFTAVLRLPIIRADCPEALRVLDHYRQVLDGRVVDPGFYPRRIRFGLVGAAVGSAVVAAAILLERIGLIGGDLPMVAIIVGSIAGFTALLIALLAWILDRRQRRRG